MQLVKLTKEKIKTSTSLSFGKIGELGATRREPSAGSRSTSNLALTRSIRTHSASYRNAMQTNSNNIPGQGVLNEVIRPTSALIRTSSPTMAYRNLMNWNSNNSTSSSSSNNAYSVKNLVGSTTSINTNRSTSSLAGADLTLIRYYYSESQGSAQQPKMEEFWSNGDRITLVKKSIHVRTS